MIGSETVHGLARKMASDTTASTGARYKHQRIFFCNTKGRGEERSEQMAMMA